MKPGGKDRTRGKNTAAASPETEHASHSWAVFAVAVGVLVTGTLLTSRADAGGASVNAILGPLFLLVGYALVAWATLTGPFR